MKLFRLGGLLAGLTLLGACVTINIYFPAAQAEAAAEKIVDDILGTDPKAGTNDKGAGLLRQPLQQVAFHPIDFLIPSAQAAAPDYNVDTPRIRKIQPSMKQRFPQLEGYFASGALGFTSNGLVAVRDASAISLKDKKKVDALVSAENADHNALYQAIAEANGHPEWESEVRTTFARTWIDKAGSGWWYQDAKGNWRRK